MMRHNNVLQFAVALVAGTGLWARPASAHIDLLQPEARAHGTGPGDVEDVNSNQKNRPCGQATDTGRGDRIGVYAPGETIEVVVREEINHESYIRISLNPEGDTFPYRPEEAIVPADDDPAAEEAAIDQEGLADGLLLGVFEDDNDVAGGELRYQVTLPADLECDNCTLQVIQFMYNRSGPYYYQCADLAITADAPVASGDSDAGLGEGSPADAGVAPDASATMDGTGGIESSGGMLNGADDSGGSVAAPPESPGDDDSDSGCSVAAAGSGRFLEARVLLLLGVCLLLRRRR